MSSRGEGHKRSSSQNSQASKHSNTGKVEPKGKAVQKPTIKEDPEESSEPESEEEPTQTPSPVRGRLTPGTSQQATIAGPAPRQQAQPQSTPRSPVSEDIIMTEARQDHHMGGKTPKPQTYDRNPRYLTNFASDLRLYIYFEEERYPPGPKQVLLATTFLRGSAKEWIRPYLTIVMDSIASGEPITDELTKEIFYDLSGFAAELRKVFGDEDLKAAAERKLNKLTQGSLSVAEYTTRFREYVVQVGWNDEAKLFAYYQGLSKNIQMEIIRKGKPSTLADTIEAAQSFSQMFKEMQHEKAGFYQRGKNRGFLPKPIHIQASTAKPPYKNKKFRNRGGIKLSPEEVNKYKKEGRCFFYRQEGHMASFHKDMGAPYKKQTVRLLQGRSFRRPTTDQEPDEERETVVRPSTPYPIRNQDAEEAATNEGDLESSEEESESSNSDNGAPITTRSVENVRTTPEFQGAITREITEEQEKTARITAAYQEEVLQFQQKAGTDSSESESSKEESETEFHQHISRR